jgi:hypothetical protein
LCERYRLWLISGYLKRKNGVDLPLTNSIKESIIKEIVYRRVFIMLNIKT